MIKFDRVTKTFPSGATALKDISFEVKPSEMVVITGPSGSGKTTLLRLLIRELIPTEGVITVDDLEVTNLQPKEIPQLRRLVGPVFQDFNIAISFFFGHSFFPEAVAKIVDSMLMT